MNKSYPKVSVFLPTYQHKDYIANTIESILAQDYPNLEVVIGDDGSTDGTREIVEQYKKKYPDIIKAVISSENTGITKNCNRILQHVTGEFVALFSGDDIMLPGKLLKQVAWFKENPSAVLCFHLVEMFDSKTNSAIQIVPDLPQVTNLMETGNIIDLSYKLGQTGMSFLVRREAIPDYGFEETISDVSDWLFWIEIMVRGKIGYINEVLARYRKHPESYSSSAKNMGKMFNDHMMSLNIVDQKYPALRAFTQEKRRELIGLLPKEYLNVVNHCIQYLSSQNKESNCNFRVSAIVSTYNSQRFIKGCLDDLIAQTLYKKGQLEIVVVNTGSQQNEEDVVLEYRKKYNNIEYIKIAQRETVYQAWNRGIKAAKGKYVTNANTDDRHRADALEVMADELDSNAAIALVYGNQFVTKVENETFESHTAYAAFLWPEFNRTQLLHTSCCGPQPLWRKSLHDEFGYFLDNSKVAGDYEWWLRISEKYNLKHIDQFLGLYLLSDNSIEHKETAACDLETRQIREYYARKAGLKNWDYRTYQPSFLKLLGSSSRSEAKTAAKDVQPFVSVIIPTFNRPDFLQESIRSVLDQTYRNLEIIVVNDAGEDVNDIIEALGDKRVKYIRHEKNKGLAASRNTGIKNASGKYIAYLDDDDVYYPDHIEALVSFIKENNCKAAYTDAYRAHQQKKGDKYIITHKDIPYSFDFDYERILWGNFIPVLCIMHEKACLNETGMFDEKLLSHEDWDLWIRMSRKFEFRHIKKCTCEFRWRTDGSTMTSSKEEEYLETTRYIYNKYKQFSQDKPNVLIEQQKTIEWRKSLVKSKNAGLNSDTVLASIIIPVCNKLEFTSHCLEAIRATVPAGIKYEIIVVDNASTDGTGDYLKSFSGPVKVISNDKNHSYSKANNQGAAIAQGRYLIFLNNDTKPLNGWIENLIREFESSPDVAVQGAKLLYANGKIQHAGMVYGERGGRPAEPYHIYLMHDPEVSHVNNKRSMQFVTGACLAIRKEVFDNIGGFDEKYVFGWEDTDLCMKVSQEGYQILYNPEVVLYHFESVTKKFVESSGTKIMHDDAPNEKKNREYFYKKWGNLLLNDADRYYAMDGFKLDDNKLIKIGSNADTSVSTSFSPHFWQRGYDKAKTVLIKGTDAIGDNLYLTSVVASLKKRYPHLKIYLGDNKVTPKIFENNPNISGIVNGSELINYDVTVDYSGIIARLPEYYNGIGLLEIFGNIAGVKLTVKEIEYFISEEERAGAEEVISKIKNKCGLLVGLQLNTSKDIKRSYPHGQELIKLLRQRRGDISFVILGTDSIGLKDVNIFDCAEKGIALREQIALASQCDAFLTIDSAFFHLAHNFFNKPTLVITGPTNPYLIGNQEAHFSYICNKKLKCLGCYWQKNCKIECMAQLSANSVSEAFFSMLEGKNKKKHAGTYLLTVSKNEDYQKQIWSALRAKKNDEKVTVHDPDKILPEFSISWNGVTLRPNITWEGSQFVRHSLALINREMSLRLANNGFNLSIIPYEPDQYTPAENDPQAKLKDYISRSNGSADIHVRHQWPPNLNPPSKGHWVIIQPWEFGTLPIKWVEVFSSKVDEMWVPSSYVRDLYISSGVPAERVFVVPNGFDEKKFNPKNKPYRLNTKKKFRFLFVGGTIYRKGIDILLETYVKTFRKSDNVCLVIKDMGGESFYKGQTFKEKIAEIKKQKDAPEIEYIDKMLSDKELAGLYTACDVLVHPYRGEGFGLPILESMASATPAIVTNGGACLDFCNEDISMLAGADKKYLSEKKVGDLETAGFPWFYEVRPDELAEKMGFAFNNPKAVKELGKKAADFVHMNFTWDKAFEKLTERIEVLKNLPVRRMEIGSDVINVDEMLTRINSAIDNKEYESALKQLETAIGSANNGKTETDQIEKEHLLNLAGNISLVMHDTEKARSFFEEELHCNPSSATACQGLADVFFAAGEYDSAKVMYEWAVKNDMANKTAAQKLIEVNSMLGLPESDNSLLKIAGNFDELFSEAYILLEAGDFEGALNKIEASERCFNPDNTVVSREDIIILKASCYLSSDDIENARLYFEEALRENPQSSEACLGLGSIFYQSNMQEEAKVMLEWAVKNDPQNQNAMNALAKVNLGLGLDEQHSSLNDNAENPEANEFEVEFSSAYQYFAEEKYHDALLKLYETEAIYDENTSGNSISLEDVNVLKGSIYLILDDINKARLSFEKALSLNPQSSEACHGLAEIYFRAEMFAEARTMFEWAVKYNPQDESAIARLETISGIIGAGAEIDSANESPSKKEVETAVSEAYELYLNKQFDDSISRLLLANDLLDDLEHEAERNEFTSVIENMKGMNYLALKKVDKAKNAFSRALELNPESSQACAGLGEVFYLCEMDKEAKTMFEWSLKNDENNQFAITGLQKVNRILGFEENNNTLLN